MKIKRLIMLVVFVIIGSIGSALTLKAAIGVGAWDALAQTGNEITGIQVGTIGISPTDHFDYLFLFRDLLFDITTQLIGISAHILERSAFRSRRGDPDIRTVFEGSHFRRNSLPQ